MNFTETMLSKKIKEAEPALDILGADRKVLKVACQDFTNYLKFNSNLANKETNISDPAEKIEQLHKEDPVEIESFLTVWTGIWLKKWKERIKLLIGKQNPNELSKDSKTLTQAESQWTKLECKEEMIEIVVSSLIKTAEICGTQIMAEHLLKMELGKKTDLDINNKEQLLAILNNTLRNAREIAQRIGPLISVKIDKSYFCPVKIGNVRYFRNTLP